MIFKIIKLISAIFVLSIISYILYFALIIIQLKTDFLNEKNVIREKIEEPLKQEKKLETDKLPKKTNTSITTQKQNDLSKFKVLKREEIPEQISEDENTTDYSSIDSEYNDADSIPDDNELDEHSIDLEKEKSFNFSEPSNNEKPAQSDMCDHLETEAEYERCMEQNFE